MKTLLLIAILISGFALAVEKETSGNQTDPGVCQVLTYGGYTQSGGKCPYIGDVMVGVVSVDPLKVRCARLQVLCNKDLKAAQADDGE